MEKFSFRVKSVPFPEEIRGEIRGGVHKSDKKPGYYWIVIDETLPHDQYTWVLKHELAHIILGHFEIDETNTTEDYIQNFKEIEAAANNYADQMTDEELEKWMQWAV